MKRRRHTLTARRGDRHRDVRSPIQGPHLPAIETKRDAFFTVVGDTAGYLVGQWHDELASVRLEIADVPARELPASTGQRWFADHDRKTITLFRLPIQKAGIMRGLDSIHVQMMIEYTVFLAFADYLGKEPWELAPDRYRPFP